jgi:hypothetical protein
VIGRLAKGQRCDNLIAAIGTFRRLKQIDKLNPLRESQFLVNGVLASNFPSIFPDTCNCHMRPEWPFVCLLENSKKVFLQFANSSVTAHSAHKNFGRSRVGA